MSAKKNSGWINRSNADLLPVLTRPKARLFGKMGKGFGHRDLMVTSDGSHVRFHAAITAGLVLGLGRSYLTLRAPGSSSGQGHTAWPSRQPTPSVWANQ